MTIINDDCLSHCKTLDDNSIDFIVTDPPYGLKFMGKKWDYQIPGIEFWQEFYRICKPGSMMAVFGGSHTHHRLMCNIEDAGWEIRDVIMWIYGSGFPKSHNNFGLDGYGTALKPAYEPIILSMKPLDGTYKKNVEKWGIGGINIDATRIGINGTKRSVQVDYPKNKDDTEDRSQHWARTGHEVIKIDKGRWPANIILDEEAGQMLDNSGGASRFFYCAKVSTKERDKGLKALPFKEIHRYGSGIGEGNHPELPSIGKNFHPTIKPISLMKYVIKLLAPPNNPILLDPFCGSGSTLVAAHELGYRYIGIEKEAEYCEIANARINAIEPDLFMEPNSNER